MTKPRLLIIGAGFAGSKLAIQMHKDMDVTLVDRKPYFEINFANARAMVEPNLVDKSVIPVESMKPHGTFVQGAVTKLTDKQAWVEGREEPLEFDYVAICSGSDYAYGKSTAPSSAAVHEEYKALNESVKSAKHVVIVGGGSLGVELAGEILTDYPLVKVTLVQSKDRLLPEMPAKASAAALQWLQKHGCQVLLGDKVNASAAQIKEQATGPYKLTTAKGTELEADKVLFCTGIKVNSSFIGEELADAKDPATGAIKVNAHLQVQGHPHMLALGDVSDVPEQKLAFLANKHADVAAANLRALAKAAAAGNGAAPKLTAWKPSMGIPMQLVSIGRSYAVGQFGSWVVSGWLPTYIKSKGVVGMTEKFHNEVAAK